jgi:hypothetical protein
MRKIVLVTLVLCGPAIRLKSPIEEATLALGANQRGMSRVNRDNCVT